MSIKIFNLPDLGEGLPEAEIVEWLVAEGDVVKTDQPIASMETAKAVVEVPSPFDGKVVKFHGAAGDVIETDCPLVEFEVDDSQEVSLETKSGAAKAVGAISQTEKVLQTGASGLDVSNQASRVKVMPAVRALANSMGLRVEDIPGTGADGLVTIDDVKKASGLSTNTASMPVLVEGELEKLKGTRKAMAIAMSQSHHEVVPVTIFDDADLSAWEGKQDITVRLLRAVVAACKAEPSVNALYDGRQMARQLHQDINIGLAMDSDEGLFVPVIRDAHNFDAEKIRESINRFKQEVRSRSIKPEDMKDSTIMLSNFGMFAGKYATPIIVPPTVAIVGMGRLHEAAVPVDGKAEVHKIMPLSLSVDHRAITGGEATRFLRALMDDLQLAN